MIRICFVCLGNICRSPMAEALMREEVKKRHWEEKVQVESAAISDWELGNGVHPGSREILKREGISCDGLISTPLTEEIIQDADLLIGMDDQNIADIKRLGADPKKVFRLMDFTDQGGIIDDPWYTGEFELTFEKVSQGIQGLCHYLKENYPKLFGQ
ncbi:low molecular weight protein-tyrosine-phosphatase [Aerococcus urinae]